jgi:hypothetical protein
MSVIFTRGVRFSHAECDLMMHEYDLYTQGVISTCKVGLRHAQV